MSSPSASVDLGSVRRLRERLRAYQADAGLFVRQVIGASPTPQQDELLAAVSLPGAHVAVTSGHGTGKSAALAWIILWSVCCFPEARTPCTAPTGHQLSDVVWAEVRRWHGRMHPWFRDQVRVTADKVELIGARAPAYAVARTARADNPDAFQGFHSRNMLFLADEASGVPEEIFRVAEGALSTKDARVVLTGNPTRLTGYFYEAFHLHRDKWVRLHFHCKDSPLVSAEYLAEMADKYGEDSDIYRVRVAGMFPRASASQLIPMDVVEAAMAVDHVVYEGPANDAQPVVMGVDVARFGDDRTCLLVRQGRIVRWVERWRGLDTMQVAEKVMVLAERFGPDAVFVDGVGVGAGVVDYLRRFTSLRVVSADAGNKAADEVSYFNRRAEMWCRMRDWLAEGASLPDDRDLKQDLVGPEYGFDAKNRVQLERKEDMKKRGLSSPDSADALAMTFFQPVGLAKARAIRQSPAWQGADYGKGPLGHQRDVMRGRRAAWR